MRGRINTKSLTNIVLAIIFVVAVYCGVIGWKEYYLGEKLHLSFWSSLYLTLQLISKSTTELINNGAYPPRLDVPGSLQIARFLMPLVILSAVINVILGMTKKKLDLYAIKYFFHEHYIYSVDLIRKQSF